MAARISGEHLDNLAAALEGHDTEERRSKYRSGDFPRADRVNDLNRRYRWDTFWAASDAHRQAGGKGLYPDDPDLKDAHIDTALRSIIKPL